MQLRNSKIIMYGGSAFLMVVIFVTLSRWSQSHAESIQTLTEQAGVLGVLSYIGIMALSIVFAPLGTGFLLPMATMSYGPFLAGSYSIIGWTLGSQVAFWFSKNVRERVLIHQDFIRKIQHY